MAQTANKDDDKRDHDEPTDEAEEKKAASDEGDKADKAEEDKGDSDEAGEGEAKAKPKGDDEEEDEADDEPKPAAAKPAAKTAGKGTAPGAARRGKKPLPKKGQNSLGKSMILFLVIVGGLGIAFYLLGKDDGAAEGPVQPKWDIGKTVDVEITLVPSDATSLTCASPDEMGGKHCAFETQTKPWSKGDNTDDKKLLRPYTTTDRVQFLAAGVWSDPALVPSKLPATRFSVKCKYSVEGKLKKPSIRWSNDGQWYDSVEWYAGSVSACTLIP